MKLSSDSGEGSLLQSMKNMFFKKPNLDIGDKRINFVNWRTYEKNGELVIEGKRNGVWVPIDRMGVNNLKDEDVATGEYLLSKDIPTGTMIWKKFTGGAGYGAFGITIDGGGSAIATGLKGYIQVPYNCTINRWDLFSDVSGNIQIDVWKGTYASMPSSSADSIAGSEKPTLSAATKNQDTNLTTWTTAVNANDVIAFNVDSAATLTRINLIITVTKG